MRRTHLQLFSAITLVGLLAAPAIAQAPPADPAARAVEADVLLALRDAQRFATTDPAKAIDRLQKVLATLEAERVLAPDRRAQLIRVINDRIRVIAAAPQPTPVPEVGPMPAEVTKRADEGAKLRAGLREAVALRKQGRTAEANARAAELAKQYPDSVVGQVLGDMRRVTNRREENRATRRQVEESNFAGLADVDRLGVAPRNDREYDKDHKERMARRRADNAPTAAELKVQKALDTTVTPQFKDSRLQDVADYLSTLIGLPIVLDKAALAELNLTYNSPVTFVLNEPVAARTALRAVLRSLGLTYVVQDGMVFVTNPTRARTYLTVKVYSVADIVVPIGNPFFPVGDPIEEAFIVQSVIDMIVSTIDPESWDIRGGPGTIRYNAALRAIIVRQSQEVHTSVKASLYK
jgi:hypothetical protein